MKKPKSMIPKPKVARKPASVAKVRAKGAKAFNKKAKTEMMTYPDYNQTASDCM